MRLKDITELRKLPVFIKILSASKERNEQETILDLSDLNKYIQHISLNMTTVFRINEVLLVGEWTVSIL